MKIDEKVSTHFYWLDLVRFLAALIVVVTHTRGTLFVEYSGLLASEKTLGVTVAYALTRIGNEAVVTFFVLSGFLVGGRTLCRICEGKFKATDYAIDRFVRIMLPLIPALALTALISIIIDGNFDVPELVANILSLQGVISPTFGGNQPLWSLSYEVWFYVLVFAIGLMVTNTKIHFPSVFLIIFVLCIFTYLSPVYLFCWLIGVIAYVRMPENFSWKVLSISTFLSIYSIITIQIWQDSAAVAVDNLRSYIPSLNVARILLSAGIALIIQQLIFIKPSTTFTKKIEHMGTVFAASSYTLYLTHFPILHLLTHFGLEQAKEINRISIGIFFGSILICLVVSWLMYILFEKHTTLVRASIKKRIVSSDAT